MGQCPPADIVASARAAHARWRIPASVLLAQWALESDWGRREPPGSNNPFGEKAPAGAGGVETATHEVIDGRRVEVADRFRAFLSVGDAFDFHAEHLATSHWFIPARAKLPDVEAFCMALGGGTPERPNYSTSPDYGASLMAVIRGSDLTDYDA